MKVLIFIDWFSPAYKAGGPIQSIVNLVNQPLAGVSYRVICSNKDLDGSLLQGVRYNTWVRFNSFTEVWYSSGGKNTRAVINQLALWKPDVFYINGIYSFWYNLLPLFSAPGTRKIISARGMLHAGALSQKSIKKKLYLWIWKLLKIAKKNSFHATNMEEADFIKKIFGAGTHVFVATNFPKVLVATPVHKKESGALDLISIGLVSPMKNYLEVLNALADCACQVNYAIFGSVKDIQYWQLCTDKIKTLPPNIRVSYRGDVLPEKIQQVLDEAHVFILPSKSENFGHAIFEALSAGKPVITSTKTPWNNLKAVKAGINVSVDKEGELSEAIRFFAGMTGAEFENWSAGAKNYSGQAVDLELIKKQYRHMFSGNLHNQIPTNETRFSTI